MAVPPSEYGPEHDLHAEGAFMPYGLPAGAWIPPSPSVSDDETDEN